MKPDEYGTHFWHGEGTVHPDTGASLIGVCVPNESRSHPEQKPYYIMKRNILTTALLCLLATLSIDGKVSLSNVFSDNMVLQQGKTLHIWGTADSGESVCVSVGGRKAKAKAGADGHWSVEIEPMKASSRPVKFTVKGRSNTVSLRNVLVGEVWIASGQSNMEYSMNNHPQYCKPQKGDAERLLHEYEAANNPMIRIMYVRKDLKQDTLPTAGWQTIGRESLRPFSAAAYFFAKSLQDSLKVPVGVVSTAWGGTPIEDWTPADAYKGHPRLARLATRHLGNRYNRMVKPMAPMAIRGFLWYQGEANLVNGETSMYADRMEAMVKAWRKEWGDTLLPFYYVQISPFRYSDRRKDLVAKTWQDLPRFWDAQTSCLSRIAHSGMVVTTDIPENLNDIHPPYKWTVGERLAKLALNRTYGRKDVVAIGPRMRSVSREGDSIVVEFDNAEDGLTTRDGKAPDWFVAMVKRRYVSVKAKIDGNRVIVSGAKFDSPLTLNFGWDEIAQPNLTNKAGLPAVPFHYSERNKK